MTDPMREIQTRLEKAANPDASAWDVLSHREHAPSDIAFLLAHLATIRGETIELREALELIQGFNWALDDSPHGQEITRRCLRALASPIVAKRSDNKESAE